MKEENRSCPCLYLENPCHKNCTCVNKFSSSGCQNCCTYGSLEQRTKMAELLNKRRLSNKKFVTNILPSEKEANDYVRGSFGFERDSFDKESAFISGVDWTLDEIKRKL